VEAQDMTVMSGILCNWWRRKGTITPVEIMEELTEENVFHHLNNYDRPLPPGHKWKALGDTYGDVTAFISCTAGSIQRDSYLQTNILFDPFVRALDFSTRGFRTDGYIFYAYVTTLGKQSVALQGFAEEVRELHIYTEYLPFHHEGEITAKIGIPSVNIEKAEKYDGPGALLALRNNLVPAPIHIFNNPNYKTPDNYSNIREIL
jgi:hypothetical protein